MSLSVIIINGLRQYVFLDCDSYRYLVEQWSRANYRRVQMFSPTLFSRFFVSHYRFVPLCTYKATLLFIALFRSMTHFRKSIKSRLVLSGTRTADIPLWETGLNDSHVGSTNALEVAPRYHCLTSANVEQRNRKVLEDFRVSPTAFQAARVARVFALPFTFDLYLT